MILLTEGLDSIYEIESLSRMLFPNIKRGEYVDGCDFVSTSLSPCEGGFLLTAIVSLGGNSAKRTSTLSLPPRELLLPLARLLYEASAEAAGTALRWGVLTGIRPIKLYHTLLDSGLNDAEITSHMSLQWLVPTETSQLALSVARAERKLHARGLPNGFSLYVSIPFCPARCSYCSFVSETVKRDGRLLPQYTLALCRELALVGKTARKQGLVLQTIYIGGGTPTVLEAEQLKAITQAIADSFDFGHLLEYTVEAGRPDTFTPEKLEVLKQAGVSRITVNPQTMNDHILKAVGRNHTAQDVETAFHMARNMGFSNINMDVIAGLPLETPESFHSSLLRVLALSPENITVHSLTLKRGSQLTQTEAGRLIPPDSQIAQMVDDGRAMVMEKGYYPYYLYRQKGSVGNLDNTGYSLLGQDCIYNVLMMDETQTILGAGAAAVTKLRSPQGEIHRIFARKLPYEYIKDYDTIVAQQQAITEFFGRI